MSLWRCYNPKCATNPYGKQGFDFEVDGRVAKCPKCGIDNEGRFTSLLVRLTLIHYDPPSPVPGFGMGYTLCDANRMVYALNPGEQASGEPVAVNCKKCKEHADFPKDWTDMSKDRVPQWIGTRAG